MNLINYSLRTGGILFALSSLATAEIKTPAFFSDGMVLQQETGAKLWGTADAGQDVKVSFSGTSAAAIVSCCYEDMLTESKCDNNDIL